MESIYETLIDEEMGVINVFCRFGNSETGSGSAPEHHGSDRALDRYDRMS